MSRVQKVVVGTPYKIRAHRVCAVIPQVKKRPGGARRDRGKVTNHTPHSQYGRREEMIRYRAEKRRCVPNKKTRNSARFFCSRREPNKSRRELSKSRREPKKDKGTKKFRQEVREVSLP